MRDDGTESSACNEVVVQPSYNDNTTDSLVVSTFDKRPRGRGFESAGCGLSCSNRGLVALCTLGLGLLNPPSSPGRL